MASNFKTLFKMPKAHTLPVITDVEDVFGVPEPSTSTVSTQTDDCFSSTELELQQKVVSLEQRHLHLTRALSVVEMIQIQPQTRLKMINDHSKILLQDVEPLLDILESTGINFESQLQTLLQGIITRWTEAECFVDMLGTTSIVQYPMSRGRPVFSFQNYLDVYDPTKGTVKDSFNKLLSKFSIRLPAFRSQLALLRPNHLYKDVVYGYLAGVATSLLFHQKDMNPQTYRYPLSSPLWTNYDDKSAYDTDVVHPNGRDLQIQSGSVPQLSASSSGVLDLSAQRNFYKTQNKRKQSEIL